MKPSRCFSQFFVTLCWLLTLLPLPVFSIDRDVAAEVALRWLQQHSSRTLSSPKLTLDFAQTPAPYSALSPAQPSVKSSAFLFSTASHFVLVGEVEGQPVVLGYGNKGEGQLPPALQNWMVNLSSHSPQRSALAVSRSTSTEAVSPLLTFVRHQSAPYNNCCPFYKDNGIVTHYRCLVGCVATALEEVISYYRREVVLQDTLYGWETEQYKIDPILPGTRVDCQLIRDNYDVDDYTDAEVDAVARLSYYCGVAAHMRWGIASSGANVRNLVDPMRRAFGYGYVHWLDSYRYDPKDWVQLLRKEIQHHRPVLYAAFNMWLAGHAFVLDGLDNQGFFHVNWGYGGSYDGYFCLDVLNFNEPPEEMTPEGMEAGFFSNHQALLLHPDAIENELPQALERTGREVALDSMVFHLPPETGKHTPVSIYVRNLTDRALTTPLEFFTNAIGDTMLLEQADFAALASTRLAPREAKRYLLHANFTAPGQRVLRVSPDDTTFIFTDTLTIADGKPPQLSYDLPALTFTEEGGLQVVQRVHNAPEAGRCGQEVLYELGEGDAATVKDGTRHSRHLYVLPGTTLQDTVRFAGLQPGTTYTLLVRSPWKVQTQRTFVYPAPAAVEDPLVGDEDTPAVWYRLDGNLVADPASKGVYIRKKGKITDKIFIH